MLLDVELAHTYHIPYSRFATWSEHDKALARAFLVRSKLTCPSCGTRADEWDEDENAYVADVDYCEGCSRSRELEKQLGDSDYQAGARVGLKRLEDIDE